MPAQTPSPGFAPNDLTDGKKSFEWQSRYPKEAKFQIRCEAAYVVAALFLTPLLMFIVWYGCLKHWLSLDDARNSTLSRYCYAWLGGMLGGTLYDLKWLYHIVAKGMWHVERRLWRILIPHISGGLAFATVILISSGILRIFDVVELSRPSVVVGVSFLVGYFSDTAIGKLTEVANTLFGSSGKRYPGEHPPDPAGPPHAGRDP